MVEEAGARREAIVVTFLEVVRRKVMLRGGVLMRTSSRRDVRQPAAVRWQSPRFAQDDNG